MIPETFRVSGFRVSGYLVATAVAVHITGWISLVGVEIRSQIRSKIVDQVVSILVTDFGYHDFGHQGLVSRVRLQGYLAHKKQHPSLGPPYGPGKSLTVGFKGEAFSYERGTPVPAEGLPRFLQSANRRPPADSPQPGGSGVWIMFWVESWRESNIRLVDV